MARSKPGAWELRWHPFRAEWVLFTSHRGARPWLGERCEALEEEMPAERANALAPGGERLGGVRNPEYRGTWCFTNDLPPFSNDAPACAAADSLYRTRPAQGTAEVICYHHDPRRTMADLDAGEVSAVVELWTERTAELGARPEVNSVLIFENKGALTGTSNPHPHCQIYAGALVYATFAREAEVARAYLAEHGETIAEAVVRRELAGPRIVCQNEEFLACVPWFARYAYEVHILPKRPAAALPELDSDRRSALAAVLREVCIRYDNLWRMRLPYVLAVHQAPTDGGDHRGYPLHLEFHPPLRSPDTLKYLAGPEIGGGSMTNESDPDEKAAELRALPARLYRERPPG